jgi:hypothetical protein
MCLSGLGGLAKKVSTIDYVIVSEGLAAAISAMALCNVAPADPTSPPCSPSSALCNRYGPGVRLHSSMSLGLLLWALDLDPGRGAP